MSIVKHLIAETFGSHIGKYSERLKITQNKEVLAQAPLLHLESLHVLSRGVSISADALEACCDYGIPVHFLDNRGTPYASVYAGGLAGTAITRREQLRAYDDSRGVRLALSIAAGKIQNQVISLKYLAKTRKDTPVGEELHLLSLEVQDYLRPLEELEGNHVETIRETLMAIEGSSARVYWKACRQVVPEQYSWEKREGRGAKDPVNSLLNYGYGILYGEVERALVQAGLDPFAGFIHVDRPGKPSLTLDFIEEFRQVVVDRVVLGLVARHFKVEQEETGMMTDTTKRSYAEHILSHLDAQMRYQGKRFPLRQIIQAQARQLASFLRGETESYLPYRAEW
jgi:CRISP-associated protein Cas1